MTAPSSPIPTEWRLEVQAHDLDEADAAYRHLAQRGNPTGRPRRSSAASRRRHARRALAQAAGGAR